MNGICEAKWLEVHNIANILLNNARHGGAFFHHAHACAVQILNVCPAKNVTAQNGNQSALYQFSFQRKPRIANFHVFGCPTFFKRYKPTFRNKVITYKQQLQRAFRGIFLGFPDNSAGWLFYSPNQLQSLIITRDAYFDEDINSALCFNSKPFARAVPICSHLNPNGLNQTGSAANLGNPLSTLLMTQPLPLPSTLSQKQQMTMMMKMNYLNSFSTPTPNCLNMMTPQLNMVQHHLHHIKPTMSTKSTINTDTPNFKS